MHDLNWAGLAAQGAPIVERVERGQQLLWWVVTVKRFAAARWGEGQRIRCPLWRFEMTRSAGAAPRTSSRATSLGHRFRRPLVCQLSDSIRRLEYDSSLDRLFLRVVEPVRGNEPRRTKLILIRLSQTPSLSWLHLATATDKGPYRIALFPHNSTLVNSGLRIPNTDATSRAKKRGRTESCVRIVDLFAIGDPQLPTTTTCMPGSMVPGHQSLVTVLQFQDWGCW